MISFFHTFHPQAIIFSWGIIEIHWYGLTMVAGMIAALITAYKLTKYYHLETETIFDLSFWLIIGGLIGARIYDDLLQLPYYIQHPLQSIEIWKGGLAIHGGIIAGLLIIYWFAKKKNINFWKLSAIFVPGLALAQAIGRWGNYFNQEIFGLPTKLPWGIPIDLVNRPAAYLNNLYFQPTFLYASLGCFIIFLVLIMLNIWAIKNRRLNRNFFINSIAIYLILYSLLRFLLEFIRLDPAPIVFGLRWPQDISLLIMVLAISLIYLKNYVPAFIQKTPKKR